MNGVNGRRLRNVKHPSRQHRRQRQRHVASGVNGRRLRNVKHPSRQLRRQRQRHAAIRRQVPPPDGRASRGPAAGKPSAAKPGERGAPRGPLGQAQQSKGCAPQRGMQQGREGRPGPMGMRQGQGRAPQRGMQQGREGRPGPMGMRQGQGRARLAP